jgi:hypothetical protein
MTGTSVAQARLFFAHQSVGADLIAGIESLASRRRVPAIEGLTAPRVNGSGRPALLHAALGRNGDPDSKLAAFAEWLEAGIGREVDHAMVKFCYVDLTSPDQAENLARAYDEYMARIRAAHPAVRLVHCTIPLRTLPQGIYATARRLLGHRHAEVERNRARELFNAHLRRQHAGEPLFDLARIESTRPDGKTCDQRRGAVRVPGLVPDYTSDGGHLNNQGRQIVASAFLDMFDALGAR